MSKHLYAIPTMMCNLKCPHCFINDTPEVFNEKKFLSELNSFEGSIGIFGGEATVNIPRLMEIISSNDQYGKSKIGGISTNLLILNDRLIDLYKNIRVSTSWNPLRFPTDHQYDIWRKNCQKLSDNDISYRIMVTLTTDLIDGWDAETFLHTAHEWLTPTLSDIKFEHYVGEENTPEYFDKADEWLCDIYKHWNLPVDMELVSRGCSWNYNCSDIYTLYPDGTIKNECPHASARYTPVECVTCERAEICRPCRLQKYCSYPKKLAELIKLDKEGDKYE